MAAFTAAEIQRGDWLPLTPGLEFVLILSGVFLRARDDTSILNPPAISIVARKNSASAPFERITWNEFRQCELHIVDNGIRPSDNDTTPMTAIGPGGLKLFSIHVALGADRGLPPGVGGAAESNERDDAEAKCLQLLQGLLQQYPNRPPNPIPTLRRELQKNIPGLTERGFRRCLSDAQKLTGNWEWSRPGAPRKSRQKSPHKN
jgi:hypothetical protein